MNASSGANNVTRGYGEAAQLFPRQVQSSVGLQSKADVDVDVDAGHPRQIKAPGAAAASECSMPL